MKGAADCSVAEPSMALLLKTGRMPCRLAPACPGTGRQGHQRSCAQRPNTRLNKCAHANCLQISLSLFPTLPPAQPPHSPPPPHWGRACESMILQSTRMALARYSSFLAVMSFISDDVMMMTSSEEGMISCSKGGAQVAQSEEGAGGQARKARAGTVQHCRSDVCTHLRGQPPYRTRPSPILPTPAVSPNRGTCKRHACTRAHRCYCGALCLVHTCCTPLHLLLN